MANIRALRINEEFRREIEDILSHDVKDPGLAALSSVVRVEVTRDLSYAKVFVSVLGTEEQRLASMQALERASGFIRRELAARVGLRRVPSLLFVSDDSIEYAIGMSKRITQVIEQDESR